MISLFDEKLLHVYIVFNYCNADFFHTVFENKNEKYCNELNNKIYTLFDYNNIFDMDNIIHKDGIGVINGVLTVKKIKKNDLKKINKIVKEIQYNVFKKIPLFDISCIYERHVDERNISSELFINAVRAIFENPKIRY